MELIFRESCPLSPTFAAKELPKDGKLIVWALTMFFVLSFYIILVIILFFFGTTIVIFSLFFISLVISIHSTIHS